MNNKLTPQQALEMVASLTGKDVTIRLTHDGNTWVDVDRVPYMSLGKCNIDWQAFDYWPPPEPSEQWRDAVMPQDWGKPCRYMALDTWLDGVLVGKHTAKRKARWIVEQPDGIRNESSECQVRVEPKEDATRVKPILGILPRDKHREYRIEDLEAVIARFEDANQEPKAEWIEELNDLTRQLVVESIVEPNPTGKDCLQVDDGWKPMDSAPKDRPIELLMGGKWYKGRWHCVGIWISDSTYNKTLGWDRNNQPTGWRPL
jgi:hypothetical protein